LYEEIEKKLDFIYDDIATELSLPHRRRQIEDDEFLDVDGFEKIDPDERKKMIENLQNKK